jgi:hypothetical protein
MLLVRELPRQGCNMIVIGNRRTLAVSVGRAAAFCVHPYAAWRLLPGARRMLLVSAYAAGAYLAVLTTLLLR